MPFFISEVRTFAWLAVACFSFTNLANSVWAQTQTNTIYPRLIQEALDKENQRITLKRELQTYKERLKNLQKEVGAFNPNDVALEVKVQNAEKRFYELTKEMAETERKLISLEADLKVTYREIKENRPPDTPKPSESPLFPYLFPKNKWVVPGGPSYLERSPNGTFKFIGGGFSRLNDVPLYMR